MDVFGGISAAIGLAATVFDTAKGIRDNITLAISEKAEIVDLMKGNEGEMQLLEELYNEHKELLDQTKLTKDLERLQEEMKELNSFLSSKRESRSKGTLPNVREVWEAGDLKPKLEAWNQRINLVRNSWQIRINTRTLALVRDSSIEILDRMDDQSRANANASLAVVETIRSEATEVIRMIQQTTVRQRVRTLSMHSQVEPAGFNSQTTRVVTDVTTSTVTFSILSPDTSLSYDCIKLRLQEYRELLETDSPTIEFTTELGKTILCRKEGDQLEEFLIEAERLLQDMIDAQDVSTTVVIHRLRDLAQVLDNLRLEDECRLVGNCALNLSQALALRSLEFRLEHAATIALIAGLSVYQPRVRTLFMQAITICEEVVTEDNSNSNEPALLDVLIRAARSSNNHLDLGEQCCRRALQIMTREPSLTMLSVLCFRAIYVTYSVHLRTARKYSEATEVYQEAMSYYRKFGEASSIATVRINAIVEDPSGISSPAVIADSKLVEELLTTQRELQATVLEQYALSLFVSGRYPEAESIGRDAVTLYGELAEQDPAKYNKGLVDSLDCLSGILSRLQKCEESAAFGKQSISIIIRSLMAEAEDPTWSGLELAMRLGLYGLNLINLEQYSKAVEALEGAVLLYRGSFTEIPMEHKDNYATVLQLHAGALIQLGKYSEAAAAGEKELSLRCSFASRPENTLALGNGLVQYRHSLQQLGRLTEAIEKGLESVASFRIVITTRPEYKNELSGALHNLARDYAELGQHADAIKAFEEGIQLRRDLAAEDPEKYTRGLANSLHDMAISFHALERPEQAELAAAECIQLCKGKTLKNCQYEPNFEQCFVCRRVGKIPTWFEKALGWCVLQFLDMIDIWYLRAMAIFYVWDLSHGLSPLWSSVFGLAMIYALFRCLA